MLMPLLLMVVRERAIWPPAWALLLTGWATLMLVLAVLVRDAERGCLSMIPCA